MEVIWSPEQIDDIVSSYKTGEPLEEIATRYSRHIQTVRKLIVSHGVKIKKVSDFLRLKNGRKPSRSADLTGFRFNRLTVISRSESNRHGQGMWKCLCDCGKETTVVTQMLKDNRAKSCGCYKRAVIGILSKTHGMSKTAEYRAWQQMRGRCEGKRNPTYIQRGITVCDRWKESFQNFFADMGKRPSDFHSLDRINNDGNYEPGNCRWATPQEQANNNSHNRFLTFNGETLSLAQWTRKLGLRTNTIRKRLEKGKTVSEALTMPQRNQTNRVEHDFHLVSSELLFQELRRRGEIQ